MGSDLIGKYFVRKNETDTWMDITQDFSGVNILKIDGFNEGGETVNVYSEQWVTSNKEDVMVTMQDERTGEDIVIRKNGDLKVTFICGQRYGAMNTREAHDEFIDFMCNHGTIWIWSKYQELMVQVICLKGYKPTMERLQRGNNSYIMGTIDLHMVDAPHRYRGEQDDELPPSDDSPISPEDAQ